MARSPRRTAPRARPWDSEQVRRVATPVARVVAGVAVLATLCVAAAKLAEAARRDPRFLVDPAAVVGEEAPHWLPSNLARAIRDELATATPVNIFDPEFAARLRGEVMRVCPWVADVRRIERLFPSRARVELVVRQPAAAVDVGPDRYLIDGAARVLHREPKKDASRFTWLRVLPILGADVGTPPALGSAFEDPDVLAAAQVAAELQQLTDDAAAPLWGLDLVALDVSLRDPMNPRSEGEVYLLAKSGVLVRWGRAAASEHFGLLDPPVEKKLRHLRQLLDRFPRLEGLEEARLNFDGPYYRRPQGGAYEYLRDDP